MKNNYRIVAVTPAGRRSYMEILRKYIYKNKHILDRWDIWMNTNNEADIQYLHSLKFEDPDFINIIESRFSYNTWGHPNLNISPFWDSATEEDVIYIRFDDDIVYIADNTIESLVEFRIKNENYLFVYPFIINNVHHSRNLQERGLLSHRHGTVRHENDLFGQNIYDPVGLMNSNFAYEVHDTFFKHFYSNTVDELMTPNPIVWQYGSQISINCICWFGSFMKTITPLCGGQWPVDEENFLTTQLPGQLQMPLVTIPNTLVCHYMFRPQRDHGEINEILQKYKSIANDVI